MAEGKDQQAGGRGMKKTLGVASVFAICTGAAFSSGFFLLPGFAADQTGPALPLIFLIAGLLMLPAIFSISELASAMPRSGGPYFFITRSFGPLLGIIGTLGMYLQWLLKGAFAFVGVGYYLSLLVNVPIEPVAIGLIIFFTLVNLVGVKQTSTTEIILVGVLILVLGLFVVAGAAEILPRADEVASRFQPLFTNPAAVTLGALAMVFISFGGMGQIASVAAEIKEPGKTIPRGMLYSLGVVSFFYLAGTAVIIGLVEMEDLFNNPTPVAEAAEQFQRIQVPVIVITIAALAAFTSTGNAVILSAARYPLALARDQLLWKKFSKISKKGIPVLSVVATGIILILLVLALDVEEIAEIASGFLLLIFTGMCLSLIIFRESHSGEYKPSYNTPFYPWMQIMGALIYLALIVASGVEVWMFIAGIIILGFLWYYLGIQKTTSFSAAIYPLFGRIARAGGQGISSGGIDLSLLQGEHLSSLVERAMILELEEEQSLSEVISRAAAAITERVGGEKENVKEQLLAEIKHLMHPVEENISFAPALLEGIEQPEMIIVKGQISINDHLVKGLVILIDDHDSSGRLVKLSSQLETAIRREGFSRQWQKAESARELKQAFLLDIRTLTFRLEKGGKTADMIGKKIADVQLPEASMIILIQRKGKLQVPVNEALLEEGDHITLVTKAENFEELRKKFTESI